ncbi:MAG: hypothetical protein K9M82_00380 [Deltaproteobacteria bacterium]|nr:hypothetical protein [Deltaproteobacteria bacterium]
MIDREPFPFRGLLVFLVLGTVWTGAAYAVFVGAVSIWVGVCNLNRQGFWMPLVIGGLTIGISLRLAFPLTAALGAALGGKKEDEGLALND